MGSEFTNAYCDDLEITTQTFPMHIRGQKRGEI